MSIIFFAWGQYSRSAWERESKGERSIAKRYGEVMVQLSHLNVSFKHVQIEGGVKMGKELINQANSGTLNCKEF